MIFKGDRNERLAQDDGLEIISSGKWWNRGDRGGRPAGMEYL